MLEKRLLIGHLFLAAGLVVSLTTTAFAVLIDDLKNDWSNLQNPNGSWSYEDSLGPITIHQSAWGSHEAHWVGQDAWALTDTGRGHIVSWMKSEHTLGLASNGLYDLSAGDITVHTWDEASGDLSRTNSSRVKWTAPRAGTYSVSGNMWLAFMMENRAVNASVTIPGNPVLSVHLSATDPYSRNTPYSFSVPSVTLLAGNIIEMHFETDVTGVHGTHVGMNLTVTNLSFLPGDYNENGVVDAADYVVWRDNLGSGAPLPNDDTPGVGQDDYDRWKANFGSTSGTGSIVSGNSAIPEPSTFVLLLLLLAAAGYNLRSRWHPAPVGRSY
jgi:hypothetical protein